MTSACLTSACLQEPAGALDRKRGAEDHGKCEETSEGDRGGHATAAFGAQTPASRIVPDQAEVG